MKKKICIFCLILLFILLIGFGSYSFFSFFNSSSGASEVVLEDELKLLSFEMESLGMKVGTSINLPLAIEPVNATVDELIWESSNSDVATVDNEGMVVAISKGTCEISVKTSDGFFGDKITINVEEDSVDIKNVKLDKSNLELYVSETHTLLAEIEPNNATNKLLRWTSSDDSIVSVNNGVVTANGVGSAVVKVTSEDGKHVAECKVIVKNIETIDVFVKEIKISNSSVELKKGDSKKLTATVLPENATDKTVVWVSSNSNVVSVDNGTIIAKESGVALVTVISSDGKYKSSCEVTVFDDEISSSSDNVSVIGIKISDKNITLNVGDKYKLSSTVYPENATNKSVDWSSSNPEFVTVDEKGNLVAKKAGSAVISASAENGKYVSKCNVLIIDKSSSIIPVEKIVLSGEESLRLEKGKTINLTATIYPAEATNKNVVWTSSNNDVVSVSKTGVVVAKKAGTVNIIVSSEDGSKKDSVEIVVFVPEPSVILPTSLSLSQSSLTLDVGGSKKIVANVEPNNVTNPTVSWVSNNPNVATVSSNGVITAKSAGVTEIIAIINDIRVPVYVTVNNGFEISYFLGLYAEEITREDVKAIKDMGITLVPLKSGCYSGAEQRAYMGKAIKLFAEYGIDVLVSDYQMFNLMLRKREAVNDFGISCSGSGSFCTDYSDDQIKAMLQDMINAYSGYSNVVGWDITDEPSTLEFDRVEKVVNYLNSNSNKYSYVNLFPNYVGNEYIFENSSSSLTYYNNYIVPFSQRIKIPVLSVDHYMEEFINKGLWDSKVKYYVNMLNILEASRATGKFPMNVTLATHMKEINYNAITYNDLAWQNSVNLAFGMKRISYFSYKNTAANPAIVSLNGSCKNNNCCANPPTNSLYIKTELYNNVSKINKWTYGLGNELYTKQVNVIYDFNDGILTQYKTVNSKGIINASLSGLISIYNDDSFLLVNTETKKSNVFTFGPTNPLKGIKYFNSLTRKWEVINGNKEIDGGSINISNNTITLTAGHSVLLKK